MASKDNYDRWFKVNRFIYARLQLDERKEKQSIKTYLFKHHQACGHCGKVFLSRKGVDLHRVNSAKGYVLENCILLHPKCHKKVEQKSRELSNSESFDRSNRIVLKVSKRYHGRNFLYWWDVTPGSVHQQLLRNRGWYLLIEKDTGKRYKLSTSSILKHLTDDRQTSRGKGNWGIRILRATPGRLSLEPADRTQTWLFIAG